MVYKSENTIRQIVTWLAGVIAVLVTLSIPVGYFATTYYYESEYLQERTVQSANQLSEFIYLNPKTWRYQIPRLRELLDSNQWRQKTQHQQIHDTNGNLILDDGIELEKPTLVHRESLTDGHRIVAYISLTQSIRPILLRTAWISIFSLLLGISVYSVLKILPLRSLIRVLTHLKSSQESLSKEVKEKEQALAKAEDVSSAMQHLAMHDSLTGLPNRNLFIQRLQRGINALQNSDEQLAIIMMDLDRFKEINDTLGHHIGDMILQEVATRLVHLLRSSDTVARLGGDEFAMVISNVDKDTAGIVAEKIIKAISPPINIDDYQLSIEASIGVAMFPEDGAFDTELVQHADIAMYEAKRNKTAIAFYDPSCDNHSLDRLKLVAELPGAIENDELLLHYQPKMELKSTKLWGVEALVRWQHPKEGMIPPVDFIPLAEQTGRIQALTMWVLNTALMQAAEWQRGGYFFSVAVNLSAMNLRDRRLPQKIKQLLKQWKIEAKWLTLEITETAMIADPVGAMQVLEALDHLGVKTSIDDFGTGYSSLSYLKRLPVSELKIDRSFLASLATDNDDQVIVRSIIELAHNMGLEVVAEGIEDRASLDLLQEYGCDLAQGFYLCKPMTSRDLETFLHERNTTTPARDT